MKSSSEDIKDMILAEMPELVFGEILHISREPISPENTITIYDTPSAPPMLTYKRGEEYEYPAIQVRVRNIDFQTGWDLAERIKNILHARGREVWNDVYYSIIACSSGPNMLGWDENDRVLITVNFEIQRKKKED